MDRKDLVIPAFFTTDVTDIWKLCWYCLEPTCELENMETHEKQSFGMGGVTAEGFRRIELPRD